MAGWKPLNAAQLEDCFETDWANTRVAKMLKNETDL